MSHYSNMPLAGRSDDLDICANSLLFGRRRALNALFDNFQVVQTSSQRWTDSDTAWAIVGHRMNMVHKFLKCRIESREHGKHVSARLSDLSLTMSLSSSTQAIASLGNDSI